MPPAANLTTRRPLEFPNVWSRILLKRQFQKQFIVPPTPPAGVRGFFRFVERCLKIDTAGIEVRKPIFLIGLHRSGTTMLQDLICSLPEVGYITNIMNAQSYAFCGAEVCRRRLRLDCRGERYLQDGVMVSGGSPNEGAVFWQSWLREDPHDLQYRERRMADFSPAEIAAIYETIRKILWCFVPRAQRFFCKNPCLLPYVGLLGEMFPDAKFVHIVRHPAPCATSMLKLYRMSQEQLEWIRAHGGHDVYTDGPFMPYPRLPRLSEYVQEFGADDLRTTARLWRDGIEQVQAVKDRLPAFLEVRYEDILADKQRNLGRVLEFCELTGANEQAAFVARMNEVGKVATTKATADSTVIDEVCGEIMKQYGYKS